MRNLSLGLMCMLMLLSGGIVPAQTQVEDLEPAAIFSVDTGSKALDEVTPPGIFGMIAMYPVNRVLDVLDVVRLDVGFGLGLQVNAHATRAVQLGVGGSEMTRVGLDGRDFGLFSEQQSELSVLPFSIESYRRRSSVLGTFEAFDTATQREQLYRGHRDYLGVGASVNAAIVGVQAEVKPTEIADFLTGIVGIDLMQDDHPRRFTRDKIFKWNAATRDSTDRMVIVTSRVTYSGKVGAEKAEGIAAYNHRANGMFYYGELGRALGSGKDHRLEDQLNEGLTDLGFSIDEWLARNFAEKYNENLPEAELVVVPPFHEYRVEKQVGHEVVSRLPNYEGLCEALGANTICDLRILEWALFKNNPSEGLRVRLNVECKIIRYPKGEVLVDVSELVYDVEKKTLTGMDVFLANSSREVLSETAQAVDILVAKLIDRLTEQ